MSRVDAFANTINSYDLDQLNVISEVPNDGIEN